MFSSVARRVARPAGRRTMSFDTWFVTKNTIHEKRVKWNLASPVVGAENPTFLKRGLSSKVLYYGLIGWVSIGLTMVGYGEYCMIQGINKKPLMKEY